MLNGILALCSTGSFVMHGERHRCKSFQMLTLGNPTCPLRRLGSHHIAIPSCIPTQTFLFTDTQCSHQTPELLRGDPVALVTVTEAALFSLCGASRHPYIRCHVLCGMTVDIFSFNKICHGVSCGPAKRTVTFCCSEFSVFSSVWCFLKLPSAPPTH